MAKLQTLPAGMAGAGPSLIESLVGDAEVGALFSDEADLAALLTFEAALAEVQAALGIIPTVAAEAIAGACREFKPDWSALRQGMVRDGVVGPALVAALRLAVGPQHGPCVHVGATSQDLVDTGLMLRLKTAAALLDARLAALLDDLVALRQAQGAVPLMAHTRMQAALPFTAADKIETWLRPLERHRRRLEEIGPRVFALQLGGPIGVGAAKGEQGAGLVDALATRLGLAPAQPWHTARDGIVELGSLLSLMTGALGKLGQDVALLAQSEVGAVRLAQGGGSSAMAHKSNPVGAEVLVALARFNAGLAGTLHQALVHENERSGAAWTLEWMTLPRMAITAGAALRHARALVSGISFKPLETDHPA